MLQIFLEGRLLHVLLTKLRQDGGYVAVEHRIRRKKYDLICCYPVAVLIQQIGHPLQRCGGFAAAGRSLDNKHAAFVITDNRVLLLLDRSHNALHLRIGSLAEHLLQQLITDGQASIEHILEPGSADLILPLQRHRSGDLPSRCIIARGAG
ncbi:hypothetical protein D3C75_616240 [compost metagenome]